MGTITNTLYRWFFETDPEQRTQTINVADLHKAEAAFAINAYATFTVIDFIACLMSQIEYQTYYDGNMKKGLEWYKLNIKPNKNQNAADFWREYWGKLLYYQEVLVVEVNGERIIADDFEHHKEFGIREDYFERVRRGDFTFYKTFPRSEVFYQQYSCMEVQAALQGVLGLYSEMISLAKELYKDSGGEHGVLNVSSAASGPAEFEQKYGEWINKRFKSYFNSRNAVMPLFKGMTYTGKTNEVDQKASADMNALFEAAIAKACNAFKIPPALFRGEVAGMGDAFDVFLTTCADPMANAVQTEMTAQEFTPEQIVSGCRINAFTNNIKHTDIFSVADKFDKLFADGMAYNDLMSLLDMPTINEEWADRHFITKNYADVQEGGGTDE